MFTDAIEKMEGTSLEKWFLAAALVLAGGLLFAVYSVCDAQTRQGEDRRAALVTRRAVLADCLSNHPRASYAQCETEVARRSGSPPSPMGVTRVAMAQSDGAPPLMRAVYSAYR